MSFRLPDAIFWIAVAACSVAQIAIIRSVLNSPARIDDAPSSTARRAAEIAWAVLPGLALVALFVFTWRAMHGPAAGAAIVAASMQ